MDWQRWNRMENRSTWNCCFRWFMYSNSADYEFISANKFFDLSYRLRLISNKTKVCPGAYVRKSESSQHEMIRYLKSHETRQESDRINCFILLLVLFRFKRESSQQDHDSDTALFFFFFSLVLNDQRMISPCEATGAILTNSCRLIFEWTKITRKMKWYIISIIIQTILHRFIYFYTFIRLFFLFEKRRHLLVSQC